MTTKKEKTRLCIAECKRVVLADKTVAHFALEYQMKIHSFQYNDFKDKKKRLLHNR